MNYIIMILFLLYIFAGFYGYKAGEEQLNKIQWIQKGLMFSVHLLGFLCVYHMEQKIQIIGFYLLQVVVFLVFFMIEKRLHKERSVYLSNHICMLLIIGMIILTRISFSQAFRQFVFISAGFVIYLMTPYLIKKGECTKKLSVLYGIGGILLLLLVLIMGTTSYGAKLNLVIGSFSFQPSEFVKILFVFFIASLLYQNCSLKRILLCGGISAGFVLLLVAARDLGGALLYFTTFIIMLYVATGKKRYLCIGGVGAVLAAVCGYLMFSHVRTRVFAWLTPLADPNDKGYQICQSLFGIGTGGWFGLGIGKGKPTKIPIVEKDFIFSAISEEMGGIVAVGIIVLCGLVLLAVMSSGIRTEDNYYRLIITGLFVFYGTQVFLTIGGAVKMIPSTGVTLPFVSYGGSSMIASMILFGLVQGIYCRGIKEESLLSLDYKNQTIAKVLRGFLLLFLCMILYFIYFMIFESQSFVWNEHNPLKSLLNCCISI